MSTPAATSWASRIAASRAIIVCGTGGVGKTTVAAAMGVRAAVESGRRVVVLTVDPARRLATALGIADAAEGEREVRVVVAPPTSGETAGASTGELWATMLDPERAWDDLIERTGASASDQAALTANPLYRQLTRRFAHAQAYVGLERMCELLDDERFDLVIVDTPPSRNALELFDAPRRMEEFFGGRLVRWLTVPARSRVLSAMSRPFYAVADRVLGGSFLHDIAELFRLLQTVEPGLIRRARRVTGELAAATTTLLAVTTLETAPLAETRLLAAELTSRGTPLSAVVVNRVIPERFADSSLADDVRRWTVDSTVVEQVAEAVSETPTVVSRVLRGVAERVEETALRAEMQRDLLAGLEELAGSSVIPSTDAPLGDVAGLLALSLYLWP